MAFRLPISKPPPSPPLPKLTWNGWVSVSPFNIHNYDTSDPNTLARIIGRDLQDAPESWFQNLWRYRLQDPAGERWYGLLRDHLVAKPGSLALRELDGEISSLLGDRLIALNRIAIVVNGYAELSGLLNLSHEALVSSPRIELLLLMTLQDPAVVPYRNKYPGTHALTGQDPTLRGDETVKAWFRHVLDHRKIAEPYETAIDADTSRQDVMTVLAYALYYHLTVNPHKVADYWKSGPSAVSRYLIADILGIHPDVMQGRSYSPRYLGDFYEAAIRLQQGLMEPALRTVHLAPELFRERDLRKIITLMESLNRLKGVLTVQERVLHWNDVLAGLGAQTITADTVDAVMARVDAEIPERFRAIFHLGNRPIRSSQITALGKRWGSLEVLFTLASRFHATPSLDEELPVLGRVVAAVLNNRFAQLKYEGAPGDRNDRKLAAEQLKVLKTPEVRAGWMADYETIGVFASSGRNDRRSLHELWRQSQSLVAQALGHAVEVAGDIADRQDVLHDIIGDLQRAPLPVTVQNYKKHPDLVTLVLLRFMKDANTVEDYQKWLGLAKATSGTLRLSLQLSEDLRSLGDAMSYREGGGEAIVYTTTTDDPHLLLKIGNLVDVSSCQDYRYGQYVETLLGYVVDANVKAVLSFALVRKHFASASEYDRAKQLAKNPKTLLVFDAPRLRLKIGDVDVALPPKAHIRQIIKLGPIKTGDAGLGVEPEYHQNHFAESAMRRQINAVLHAQAEGAGAVLGQAIQSPESRNPAGVYSDNANSKGAQRESYTLPHRGGRIQAPDADDMERVRRRVHALSGSSEGFATSEPVTRAEPLITPADVMPVPQLVRPADMVELPREGGFQMTDPKVVKKFAIPPSDKIPVVVSQNQAWVALELLAAGVLLFLSRGAMRTPMRAPAPASGGLFLTPRES